jgi:hypothetical protein
VQFVFVDDSKQAKPSRDGMGRLYALGGVWVADDKVLDLERMLEAICQSAGFPSRADEFKWSPGRDLWMRDNLKDAARQQLFERVIDALTDAQVVVNICMVDGTRGAANFGADPEEDVTRLYIERVNNRLQSRGQHGVIIADRPTGGRKEEDDFIAECADLLVNGTVYVKPDRIAFNVLTADSKMVRLLQAADLITGCSLARLAGEKTWSPSLFARMLPLYFTDSGRRGGVSAKLHPDLLFGNLYHWVFEDTHIWKRGTGYPMPHATLPYAMDPDVA